MDLTSGAEEASPAPSIIVSRSNLTKARDSIIELGKRSAEAAKQPRNSHSDGNLRGSGGGGGGNAISNSRSEHFQHHQCCSHFGGHKGRFNSNACMMM